VALTFGISVLLAGLVSFFTADFTSVLFDALDVSAFEEALAVLFDALVVSAFYEALDVLFVD
jgi:hypothetical protein